MDDETAPRRRMTAAQRERQLLRAAVNAFARSGYTGTTTDQVARIAGVSQPYVLRLFGSKQALFLATYQYAASRIQDTFRAAAATLPPDAEVPDRLKALGCAYLQLAQDRDLLLVLLHGFMTAADPALGPAMRRCMIEIYRLVRTLTGANAEQTRDFAARGMLITTLVALRMPDHLNEDPAAAELVHHTLQP
ncbi:MAG TPA: TetR/AcrR family transcriptional regulator [Pseudonocardiaceae bacterium]|nr:TetR/AcrR family transcriptional regulator [Pseudonocardiaceae bacterium]